MAENNKTWTLLARLKSFSVEWLSVIIAVMAVVITLLGGIAVSLVASNAAQKVDLYQTTMLREIDREARFFERELERQTAVLQAEIDRLQTQVNADRDRARELRGVSNIYLNRIDAYLRSQNLEPPDVPKEISED